MSNYFTKNFFRKKFIPKAFTKYFRAARFHYKKREDFNKAQSEYIIEIIMSQNKNQNRKNVREFIHNKMEYEANLAEAAK